MDVKLDCTSTPYKLRVAGLVVLYNSKFSVINNIQTYINQIEKLYIVDNSDNNDINLKPNFIENENIHYISNDANLGIAGALNIGATIAIKDGFDYLLTMDDDSKAPFNMIHDMIMFIRNSNFSKKIGIISVAHSFHKIGSKYKIVNFTMTSGSLLNLEAFKKAGEFDEGLFIDHVDHEYGMRLNINNFLVIELSSLQLEHNLGITKYITFGKYSSRFVSHKPERFYYLIRNGIYIIRKYSKSMPRECLRILFLNIKESIKSLIIEDQKKARLVFLFVAIFDAINGNYGRLHPGKFSKLKKL